MSKTAETLFVLRDNYSGTLKNIAQIQKSFTKDLDGLQKSLKELNRGRAEIKIDADKAKRELKAAQKPTPTTAMQHQKRRRSRHRSDGTMRSSS